MFDKPVRLISKKLTDSAKGKDCTVRIKGVCNFDNTTTVFAHLGGAGMGTKASDIHGAYCCSACHDWLDGGYFKSGFVKKEERDLMHLEGVIETQQIMINEGLIKV